MKVNTWDTKLPARNVHHYEVWERKGVKAIMTQRSEWFENEQDALWWLAYNRHILESPEIKRCITY